MMLAISPLFLALFQKKRKKYFSNSPPLLKILHSTPLKKVGEGGRNPDKPVTRKEGGNQRNHASSPRGGGGGRRVVSF